MYLSFFRYASCPVCNLRVQKLIKNYASFSEKGLKIVAVFQSSSETIARYVGKQSAPFPIIADPEMRLYQLYGVESRWSGLFSVRVIRAALAAFGQGFAPGRMDGPLHRVPGDFLLTPEGRVAVAHYGRDIDDHLSLEVINAWLHERAVVGESRVNEIS